MSGFDTKPNELNSQTYIKINVYIQHHLNPFKIKYNIQLLDESRFILGKIVDIIIRV